MNIIQVKYTSNIFLDSGDISPSQETYRKIQNALDFDDQMIMSVIQEMTPIGMQNRIKLDLISRKVSVIILYNCITIETIPSQTLETGVGELSYFINEINKVYSRLSKEFNKKANRLSLITNYLVSNLETKYLESLNSKVFNLPNFFSSTNPFEWESRVAYSTKFNINNQMEEHNIVPKISRTQGKFINNGMIDEFDGILLEIDVNTDAKNIQLRFSENELSEFLKNAVNVEKEVYEKIIHHLELINNG